MDWLLKELPDFLCIQETKAHPQQLDQALLAPLGFQTYWHSAKKAGYSGVAVYTRHQPLHVFEGMGRDCFDCEGRVLALEFEGWILVNAYFPNSQREHARLPYKLEFCAEIFKFCERKRKEGKKVVLCGDYNIAHRPIDLKNPKANEKNAGYLPEERAWMDGFLKAGWIDTFRHFYPEQPDQYTWWSYRPGVRERNIGWRIDYVCLNQEALPHLKDAWILPHLFGSDHCPVGISCEF